MVSYIIVCMLCLVVGYVYTGYKRAFNRAEQYNQLNGALLVQNAKLILEVVEYKRAILNMMETMEKVIPPHLFENYAKAALEKLNAPH